jgi:hypothetical protein
LLALLLIGVGCSAANAAPCYGTAMPEKHRAVVGVQSYTVINRYLEQEYGSLRSQQEFVLLSLGVTEWLSLDLKGGFGNVKQRPLTGAEIDYPAYLGGGYGFRVRVLEHGRFKSVAGFQHISVHPYSVQLNDTGNKAVLDDWQWSWLASCAFSRATPYAGIRGSRMDYIHWWDGRRERKRVQSDTSHPLGVIAGVDVPLGERVWINLEGSFVDGEAVAVSLNYRL